jgi:hypothetical protein
VGCDCSTTDSVEFFMEVMLSFCCEIEDDRSDVRRVCSATMVLFDCSVLLSNRGGQDARLLSDGLGRSFD